MVQELRILSPCGILGYGFPEESFLRGIGDTDVYGAQQYAPLMDVSIPTGGLSRTP